MSKIINIKQSDIENIVNNIVSENELDEKNESNPNRNLALVKDENGRFHILDLDSGDIVASK